MPTIFPIAAEWQSWGGLAAVVGLPIAIAAVGAALWQLHELTRTRKLEALAGVFELISSDRARLDRKHAYGAKEVAPDKVSEELLASIERASIDFERVGSLVRLGLVPKKELLEHHCEVIVRFWEIAEKHIQYRRSHLGGRHAQNFEWLASESKVFLSKNGANSSLHSRSFPPTRNASDA